MKGQMLIASVMLSMAAAACAEPGVVGGDAVAHETESGADKTVIDDTKTSQGAAEEPAADSDLSIEIPTEDAAASVPGPVACIASIEATVLPGWRRLA